MRFKRTLARIYGWRHLFPVTPLGLAVAGGGYWLSFHYGPDQMDRVLLAGGMVALGLVGLTTVAVLLAGFVVWINALDRGASDASLSGKVGAKRPEKKYDDSRAGAEFSLETGATTSTGLSLPTLGWLPLIQVRLRWEEPRQVEISMERGPGGRSHELIRPLRRGEVRRVVRRLLVNDLFGFCRFGLPWTTEDYLYIRPSRVTVTAHVMSRFLGGDYLSHPEGRPEGEMIEMRRYAHGDPLRYVVWKAFARTRKLLVRTPEVAINPRPSAAAYLVAGEGDEPAASAARFFVEQGLLGEDFLFCADGASAPTGDAADALAQIIASVEHRRAGGEGLARFMRGLDRQRRANAVLFVPPEPGRWLEAVEQAAPLIPNARVITALDAHPGRRGPSRLRNLVFSDDDTHRHAMARLHGVVRRLAARGLVVSVIHRPTGEMLSEAQLGALSGKA